MLENVSVLAFDADDTLWNNETLFREAERKWAAVMSDYGTLEELSDKLYETEAANMKELGFGAKPYLISVLETSVALAGDALTGSMVGEIIAAGREIMRNPATPLPGVRETLEAIRALRRYRMVLLTKGDLLDQEHKLERSGLAGCFDRVMITSDKSCKEYLQLCELEGIGPGSLAMVGNSFKSDIAPVLELGGWGIHIPSSVMWVHEKTEEFEHPQLIRIKVFSDLLSYVG
ncbi:MAG: HAD family hydrolase [Bacteroidales bacterium]|nr:HAD family hydrolase [Bacteroidales bacterium]